MSDERELLDRAAILVREADEFWAKAPELTPQGMLDLLQAEVVPRYEQALQILARIPSEAEESVRAMADDRRMGYETDIGLAYFKILLAFRRHHKNGIALSPSESKTARYVRERARAAFHLAVAHGPKRDRPYYTLGGVEELSGDGLAAKRAYEAFLLHNPEAELAPQARQALAELAHRAPTPFPPKTSRTAPSEDEREIERLEREGLRLEREMREAGGGGCFSVLFLLAVSIAAFGLALGRMP